MRVLGSGGDVYLLGGTSSIPDSVGSELTSLGYHVTRLSGPNRYATAVAVANALGNPTTALLASGLNYPDALAAGPAAAHVGGAVLLTDGNVAPAETAAYLSAHVTTAYAIGGPAAVAVPSATPIVGADRYATAVAVASKFFTTPTAVGISTGENFPDALAAGAFLAGLGAPLVLTGGSSLPSVTAQYLTSVAGSATSVQVFGGSAVVSDAVQAAITAALHS
jgi:putative cell wall-binding protein